MSERNRFAVRLVFVMVAVCATVVVVAAPASAATSGHPPGSGMGQIITPGQGPPA